MFSSPDLVNQGLKMSNQSLNDNEFEELFDLLERDYEEENLSFNGNVEVAKEYAENEMKQKRQKTVGVTDLLGNQYGDEYIQSNQSSSAITMKTVSIDGDGDSNDNNSLESQSVAEISTDDNVYSSTNSSSNSFSNNTTNNNCNDVNTSTTKSDAPNIPRYMVSASNPHYLAYPKESRLDYLRRVPNLLQVAMNSSNVEMLKGIIYEAFSENIVIKITHMTPFQGRDLLFQHHSSLIRNIPDFHILFTNIKRNHRIISARQFSFGTGGRMSFMQSTDRYDFLWNCFKNIPTIDVDPAILEQKLKYDQFMKDNKFIKFERKATLFLVLNESLTHIDQLISQKSTIEVFEA